jgi:diadenosine tetraphosphatase ApaH/serine/threonine PP2A family protein phosphatase
MIDKSKLNHLLEKPELISNLDFLEIAEILNYSRNILQKELLLMDLNLKDPEDEIYIIGDIHGNLHSLKRIIEIIKENDPRYIVFLGDIVDRGTKQLECLILILILKILNPTKFYLLKGNHETLEMNKAYGFYYKFIDKFKDQDKFREILLFYQVLPICLIINNSIICLHGGIPEDLEILKKLKGLRASELDENMIQSIYNGIFQILWNDPKDVDNLNFSNSFRGPGIKFFGKVAFDRFMKFNHLKFLIRAHECFPEGYKWFFNRRLLSIFSSANYRGYFTPNPASYAIIRNNEIFAKNIKPNNE